MRALIDQNRTPARFILLGSSSPALIKNSSESLAGRIVYLELCPFNISEIEKETIGKQHWFRGGYPKAFLSRNNGKCTDWLDALIRTYIEQDLPNLGLNASPVQVSRFLIMLAHYHGGIWNASNFGNALGISNHTVSKYLDYLEGAFLVTRLSPFFINIG